MKTIKTKEIDGLTIIVGAGMLSIDSVATKLAATKEIIELPETIEMIGQAKKKTTHQKAAHMAMATGRGLIEIKKTEEAKKKTPEVLNDPDKANACFIKIKECDAGIIKSESEYKNQAGAANVVNEEIKVILPEFDRKQKDIKRKNPVFCLPNAGEYVDTGVKFLFPADMTDDQKKLECDGVTLPDGQGVDSLLSLFLGKSENEQISLAGKNVDDFRGCKYWYQIPAGDIVDAGKWIESEKIVKLGNTMKTVVVDDYEDIAINEKDLTPEQSEEIRFQALTAENKLIEFDQKKAGLMAQTVTMMNELIILNDPDSLAKSQKFYNTELEKLKIVYGQ